MPRLVVHEGGERRVYPITAEITPIGRSPNNLIQIRDLKSSREHCQIERTEKGFKLVDLESQNGTLVNGTPVNQHYLRPGDRIEIGDTAIVFELPPEEEGVDERSVDSLKTRSLARRPRRRLLPFRRSSVLPTRDKEEKTADQQAGLARPAAEPVPVEDELRELVDSWIEAKGPDAVEEAANVLDEYFLDRTGKSRVAHLVRMRDNLLRLLEINKAINSEHNLKRLLDRIMDTMVELTNAERGFLIIVEGGKLNIRVARNFDKEAVRNPEFKVSHSIAEEVLKTGKPTLTADAQQDGKLSAAYSVTDLKLRSVVCVPFKVKERILGCLYLDNRFETGLFSEDDLWLLEAFSEQAAIAIETTRLIEENLVKQEQLERLTKLQDEKLERQEQDIKQKQAQLELKYTYHNIVGRSKRIQDIFHILDRVTDSDVPVLIEGESGTGKELVAKAIHFNGSRKKARFVSENCAAIPETLLESEMFGYVRGAFTGANEDRKGLFELAHGGTLFLDEIGDMPVEMQKKLLRVLQEGEIRRVGGRDSIKVDVRIISASNRDLAELVKQGLFREDLYYRVNVVKVRMPPLRERKEDIPILVEHFIKAIAAEAGTAPREVDKEALRLLSAYPWPGNVRELENEIRRASALAEGRIAKEVLKEEVQAASATRPPVPALAGGKTFKDIVREETERVERELVLQALRDAAWVKTEAARLLGVSRPTLDEKIKLYNLEKERPA